MIRAGGDKIRLRSTHAALEVTFRRCPRTKTVHLTLPNPAEQRRRFVKFHVEMSAQEVISYVRLQAGLIRESVSLPDNVDPNGEDNSDHSVLTFIREAADSFVSRRVSIVLFR